MTREEAIQILRTRIVPTRNWKEIWEALDMAIEALSADAVHIETYRELYEKYVELKHASADAEQTDVAHKPDYSYEADMYKRFTELVENRENHSASVRRKKYYIAGQITGRSASEVWHQFYSMETRLQRIGCDAYNPIHLPKGLDWGTYMQMAVAVLCSGQIDGIIMLDGWQRSKGAQIERLVAKGLGIPVYFESDAAKEENDA